MVATVQYIVDSPWVIELLGGLQARRAGNLVTRFQTQKTAVLLGYLAHNRRRSPTREELIEVLWPEGDYDLGRHRLNQAFSSLRKQLEPPGVPKGAVFTSDRFSVGLNRLGAVTDVEDFESHLSAADRAADPIAKLEELQSAIELYRGEFLTGIYDEWAFAERQRLSDQYSTALRKGIEIATKNGQVDAALSCANRLVAADPLQEESHQQLMGLYLEIGQPAAAVRQYEQLRGILQDQLGESPSAATEKILAQANQARAGKLHSFEFAPTDRVAKPSPHRPKVEPKPVLKLPIQFTRFFGREKELALASQLLLRPDIRLMTINGPGGCGKTRFSIELAKNFAEPAGFSTWFVPLADISDAKLIPDRILEVLPQNRGVGTPLQRITEVVSAFPSLLILDNFEHLAEDGSRTIRNLLESAPSLKCIVSSRDQLFLEGEQEFRLDPLPCPPAVSRTPLNRVDLYGYPSVQLFLDRAQKVKPEFQITERNAAAIADLCARLEGIPLAIELAAEWSETVSPSQMAEKLAHRFAILISRRRDIDPRHRTLRAAIDYSYSRLNPEAQRLFRFVSIFRGGFTEEGAGAVCGEIDTPGELNRILSKSLISVDRDADPVRYRMLETVREYAMDQLTDEESKDVRDSHLRHYAQAIGLRELFEPDLFDDFEMIAAEIDNLRAALKWSIDSENAALGLAMATTLSWYCSYRFGEEEGLEWLKKLLDIAPNTPDLKALTAAALNAAGRLTKPMDAQKAIDFYQRALVLREEMGLESAVASTIINLGLCFAQLGRLEEATEYYETAIGRAEAAGDKTRSCRVRVNLGQLHLQRGNIAEASTLLEKALALSKELGDRQAEGSALFGLGVLHLKLRNLDHARTYFYQSLQILKSIGDDFDSFAVTVYLSWADLLAGGVTAAVSQQILEMLNEERYALGLDGSWAFLCSFLAADQEDYELAATFFGVEEAITAKNLQANREAIAPIPSVDNKSEALKEMLEEKLGSQRYQLLKLNAANHSLSDVIFWAKNLCEETISSLNAIKSV